MSVFQGIQSTFAKGELSPGASRVDIQAYLSGLKTARNVTIRPQGGVRNRPGTIQMGQAGDSTHPVRLVPFTYSTEQAYMLEFGHEYIRFFTSDGQVVPTAALLDAYDPSLAYTDGDWAKIGTGFVAVWPVTGMTTGALKKALFVSAPYGTDTSGHHLVVEANTGDTLAVTWTVGTLTITVKLANTTPAKNTAALIQTAIRAADSSLASWVVGENAQYAAARPTTAYNSYFVNTGHDTARCLQDIAASANNTTYFPFDDDTQDVAINAWGTGVTYAVGDMVLQGGISYNCNVAHTAGTFATDLGAGKWIAEASNVTEADWWELHTLADGSVFEIPSPYAGADLFSLKFTQSADVLYITHPDYAPRQLTRINGANWRLTLFDFFDGPFMPMNTDEELTASVTLKDWVTSTAYAVGDMVHETVTDYICAIAHTSGVFATDLAAAKWIIAPSSAISGSSVKLNASGFTFDSGHVGALWEVVHAVAAATISSSFTAADQLSTAARCGSTWRVLTSNNWVGTLEIQRSTDGGLTWTAIRSLPSSGTDNYDTSGDTGEQQCLIRAYMKAYTSGTCDVLLSNDSFDWHGIVKITSVSTSILAYAEVTRTIGDDAAVFDWSEGSWSTYRGWPTCSCFYLDRLFMASTYAEPQTVWPSKPAQYTNFGSSDPMVDDDSFSVVLPSRTVNAVRNLEVLTNLIALTSDGEFSIGPGQNGIMGPTSNEVAMHTHRGTSGIDPVTVGNELILPQQMGSIIRNLIFQLSVNGYMGDNLSIISQHLFSGYSIVEMSYQQEPDSLVWAIRSDGKMLSMTYVREQEVIAWTWHDTDGNFESCGCIPNATLGLNEMWFVVRRYVNIITASLTNGQTSNPISVSGTYLSGDTLSQYRVQLSGTWEGTVIVRRSTNGGASYSTIKTFTSAADGTTIDFTAAAGTLNCLLNVRATLTSGTVAVVLGEDRRYIERMAKRDMGTDPADYIILDSALIYDGTAATSITGLSHLEGMTVNALADGNVVKDLTVTSGAITLPTAASYVIVGLPYVSDVESLRVEMADGKGTLQGRRSVIPEMLIRFLLSRGGYVKAMSDDRADPASTGTTGFNEIKQRDAADSYTTAMPLKTRDYKVTLAGGYDMGARVWFRQVDPLPFEILAVMPKVVPSES